MPKIVNAKEGGFILKMPLEGIRDYLNQEVQLDALLTDDELVAFLEQLLAESSDHKRKNNTST